MAPQSASEKVRPKKSYFSSACVYVKLPFSLRVLIKIFLDIFYFKQSNSVYFIIIINTFIFVFILWYKKNL
jgi:hypothetical protein